MTFTSHFQTRNFFLLVFLSRLTGINLSPACLIVMLTGGKITLTFIPDSLKKGEYGEQKCLVLLQG